MSRLVLLVASLLTLVLAAVAAAGIPAADAGTVVLATPDGIDELRAAVDDDGTVCVAVGERLSDQLNCPLGLPDEVNLEYDAWASDVTNEPDRRGDLKVGGATAPQVAAVEYTVRGGARVRLATVPAPAHLKGRLARLRYFLGPVPDVPAVRRLYAADGTLLAVDDDLDVGLSYDRPGPPRRRLLRGRGWTLAAYADATPLPIRGDAAHALPTVCLAVRETDDVCTFAATPFPRVEVAPPCTPQGRSVVFGLVARAADLPRRALLADGRTLAVRARPVPAALGARGLRAFAVALPPGAGLRRFDRGPATTATPSTIESGCDRFAVGTSSYVIRRGGGDRVAGDTTVALTGAPPLHLADDDADLCVALGAPTRAGDCGPATPGIADMLLAEPRRDDLAGGAVDARVPAVRVTLAGGRRVTVPTSAPAPYAGRFAPHIRVFAYRAPGGARIATVAPLDPRGRVLEAERLDEEEQLEDFGQVRDARVLLRTAGARGPLRVGVARWTDPRFSMLPCVFVVGARGLPRDGARCPSLDFTGGGEVTGIPDCRAGAVVLSTAVSHRITGIRARLRGGGTARGVLRGRVAVLVPPPDRAVTAVELLGAGGRVARRYPGGIPAATAQCGYGAFGLEPEPDFPPPPR